MEAISFAATNLVKPNLRSNLQRQQSEPPLPGGRNVFPPTPPPELERSNTGMMSRGASVRNGAKPMPAKLDMQRARPNEGYSLREEEGPPRVLERRGTARTASEPRGPASNYGGSQRSQSRRPPPARQPSMDQDDDGYPDDVYDMYRNSRGNKSGSSGGGRRQPQYIEEDEEYASDYDDGSFDEGDFEMVSNRPPPPRSRAASSMSGSGRAASRRPDIKKIRVKVHSEDVRYIMIGMAIEFPDLVDRIRDKFAMRKRFKIKVKDDDDPDGAMITVGDQDDLDMVLDNVKTNARREKLEMGKMEVCCSFDDALASLICDLDLGTRNINDMMNICIYAAQHAEYLRLRFC